MAAQFVADKQIASELHIFETLATIRGVSGFPPTHPDESAGRIRETARQERGQPCPREFDVKPGTRGHGCPRSNLESALQDSEFNVPFARRGLSSGATLSGVSAQPPPLPLRLT